ncbi:LytR/AlgR family response regulator transcription factor [Rubrolithibacter danxiaensis]|uniref:LytR/AlgR family response regulator transcription factor n=1 Tax=Rubrolithibacter danxiaensis TaxID=3390805 RepID=UPI003BF8F864
MKLKCIAVDDEPLALGLICTYIEQTPFLELTGRYSSAVEALKVIHNSPVDLIFLDIRMPDLSGIELARVLDKGKPGAGPRIVFTTAFDQFAMEGYKVDALDYLLKPFSYVDFSRAANKALAYAELLTNSKNDAVSADNEKQEEDYLFLKVEYQLIKVALNDILYIEGLKDYVKVHLESSEKPLLSLTSLKALEEKLPDKKFMRIHRSFIVALNKIRSVTRNTVQIGNTTIPVTDQYKENFNSFLSRWM